MTQKDLLEKVLLELATIRQGLPDSEVKQLIDSVKDLKEDVSKLKHTLLNPEEGVIVKVNKNTDFRLDLESEEDKQIQETQDLKDLKKWRDTVSKVLWIIFSAVVGIVVKLVFFDKQ